MSSPCGRAPVAQSRGDRPRADSRFDSLHQTTRPQPDGNGRRLAPSRDRRPSALLDRPPGGRPQTRALLPRAGAGGAGSHADQQGRDHPDLAGPGRKVTCYLSAEFLMGPQLGNNLLNLGIEHAARAALRRARPGPRRGPGLRGGAWPGQRRPGPAGGLLSGLAGHAGTPAIGYGIRYEFGIFDQEIRDGWQVEKTDNWLRTATRGRSPSPTSATWSTGAATREHYVDDAGHDRVRWVPGRVLKGVAYDTPIQGYGVQHVQHADAVERPGRRVVRVRGLQHRRLLQGGRGGGQLGDRHQGALSRTTSPRRASGCGCCSSTSSCPARCRTSCTSLR